MNNELPMKLRFSNGLYAMDDRHIGRQVETIRRVQDEDIKSALSKGTPGIPEGTELSICGFTRNYYGCFIQTQYLGNHYYLKASDLKYKD